MNNKKKLSTGNTRSLILLLTLILVKVHLFANDKLLDKNAFAQGPVEILSSTREQICLNGLWNFCPGEDIHSPPLKSEYGTIWVPGAWCTDNAWWTMVAGLHSRGTGKGWENELSDVRKAWYHKKISIPASWNNSKISIDFERISTDAIIFLDGTVIDTVNWPGGDIDITSYVVPGNSYELDLLVIAATDNKSTFQLMGTADAMVTKVESSLKSCGITGEVYLRKRPENAYISDLFVQTSVRKKNIILDVEVEGCAENGTGKLRATILDPSDNIVLEFSKDVSVNKTVKNKYRLQNRWPDPELWDLDKPYLYKAKVSFQIKNDADEYAQQFGFREFWIEGKDFYLNGTQINLKPNNMEFLGGMTELLDTGFVYMRKNGFNCMEIWPMNFMERGMVDYNKQFIRRASERGMLVLAPLPASTRFIMDENWQYIWENEGMSEAYEKEMLPMLKEYRNEPSVIMWVINPNFFGHEDDQDPSVIGTEGWIKEDIGWLNRSVSAKESCDIIKKHDPTRPVFNHHGAYTSDIHSLNNYLCLLPLQEREEWLSHYEAFGTLPFMAVEFGTPLENTFLRARAPFGFSIYTEPLFTEFAAAYLGKEAYKSETDEYRQQIADYFIQDQTYQNWQGNIINQRLPAHQAIQELFVTNTYRSWRTYGISGGMLPHMDAHGWAVNEKGEKSTKVCEYVPGRKGSYIEKVSLAMQHHWSPEYWTEYPGAKALRENNNTSLAYIAGKESDFTSKDHSVFAGEIFHKQVVVISDFREPVDYEWTCIVKLEEKEITSFSEKGKAYPASINKFPLDIKIPAKVSSVKEDGMLILSANIDHYIHKDTFHFRVFEQPEKLNIDITCFDPEGKTKRMLEQIGIEVKDWNGEMELGQLIIGREVLSTGYVLPGDIENYVQNGGKLIIMAQNPGWIAKNLGFRLSKYVSRYVFPVNLDHPALNGLDEMDLRNWNGKGTLVEEYPDYLNRTVKEGQYGVPYYGWHWGNTGSVSSAAIEKPHMNSWRPILECEFDLAYSPLLEMEYGKGRIILNMLDLEDNFDKDPAARKLTTNILKYNQTPVEVIKTAAVEFIGNSKDEKLIKELGLIYQKTVKISKNAKIVIVGDCSKINEPELKKFLDKGGKAICLYQNSPKGLFGVTYKLQSDFSGSIKNPKWPELNGISPSDTRLRSPFDMWVLEKGCDIACNGLFGKINSGKGTLLFSQINPEALNADSLTYFRYSRWRYTRALSQILSNAGCAFKSDSFVFNYGDKDKFISLEGRWRAKLTHEMPVTISVVTVMKDPGLSVEAERLIQPGTDISGLESVMVPMEMEKYGNEWQSANGEAVFIKEIHLPADFCKKGLMLDLGVIGDYDETYFNGVKVGCTDENFEEFWGYERKYRIPSGLIKEGKNIIAVRLFDIYGKGGLLGSENEMCIYPLRENQPKYYHPDYRDDFKLGDDPFRYFRW